METANPALEDLRREIDEIDNRLHDLLMRRTEISRQVGRTKSGRAVVKPGREAQVLRRLLARHRGSLPKSVLVRIWREIFSDSLAQQGPFSVSVLGAEGEPSLRGLARDHYGVLTPIGEQGSPVRVISDVAEGKASLGVLPPCDADLEAPWWRHLARDGASVPRVVARLPFAEPASPNANGATALVVALSSLEETGADRSLLVVETEEDVSRSAFRTLLGKIGLTVRETQMWSDGGDAWLHFAEVEGFVDPEGDWLARLAEVSGGKQPRGWVIGAHTVPLSPEELAPSPSETPARQEVGT